MDGNEVHVWRAFLDAPASHVERMWPSLAPDERRRAEGFYFRRDRERFIVTRGVLRAILGRYLDMEPAQLRFCYSSHGKPAIAKELGGDVFRFNLSHSYAMALFAFTRGREIGVDVERLRPDVAYEEIAERFFSPREAAVLRRLPASMQREAFFNCWTRKEAYIKARGDGLSLPLDQFDVSLVPGEPAALLNTRGDPQEASRWSIRGLLPGPGYAAAVAVEGRSWRLKCWQWSESSHQERSRRGPGR